MKNKRTVLLTVEIEETTGEGCVNEWYEKAYLARQLRAALKLAIKDMIWLRAKRFTVAVK